MWVSLTVSAMLMKRIQMFQLCCMHAMLTISVGMGVLAHRYKAAVCIDPLCVLLFVPYQKVRNLRKLVRKEQ